MSTSSPPTMEGEEHVTIPLSMPSLRKYSKRLDGITKQFCRVWLCHYIRALKKQTTPQGYSYSDLSAESTCKRPGALYVYGIPHDRGAWEVELLYELSQKATRHYDLTIFFMTSDRTLGWWYPSPSGNRPTYLAVCHVRGLGVAVKGVKGWGKRSLAFEPDALFRGYVELETGGKVKCRLSSITDLYTFGTQDSEPTVALLGSSTGAAVVSVLVAIAGKKGHEGTVKALAGVMALVGSRYWPGFTLLFRTCALGVIGGKTGILVSKKCGEFLNFVRSVELPLLVAFPFFFESEWQVLVFVVVLIVLPTYWAEVFRNRAGEGEFWRRPLFNREFEVADSVPTNFKNFVENRAIFTRCTDLEAQGTLNDETPRPAYAMGFGAWDLAAWSVGYTPGIESHAGRCPIVLATAILMLELDVVFVSTYVRTFGSGLATFIGIAEIYVDADHSDMYLSIPERLVGAAAGYCAALAIAFCLMDYDSPFKSPYLKYAPYGLAALVFIVWGVVPWLSKSLCSRLFAWLGDLLRKERMCLAGMARTASGAEPRNRCSSGTWNGMSKCRKLLPVTFPRVAGYSYYDGEIIGVNSGWYYPACGRVLASVPRNRVNVDKETDTVTSFSSTAPTPMIVGGFKSSTTPHIACSTAPHGDCSTTPLIDSLAASPQPSSCSGQVKTGYDSIT